MIYGLYTFRTFRKFFIPELTNCETLICLNVKQILKCGFNVKNSDTLNFYHPVSV